MGARDNTGIQEGHTRRRGHRGNRAQDHTGATYKTEEGRAQNHTGGPEEKEEEEEEEDDEEEEKEKEK